MRKVFYRCVDTNFTWWAIGKEYPLIDGCIQCDDSEIEPTQGFVADLCCEDMKTSGAMVEFICIVRECFEAAGKTWFRHTPGDPMPCGSESRVHVYLRKESFGVARKKGHPEDLPASNWNWDDTAKEDNQIIGWRYADATKPEPKTIREHSREEPWTDAYAIDRESDGSFTLRQKVKEPALIWQRAVFHEYPASDANTEMQQADLAAMDDPGHLTPSQRRHIDAMEEKQAAKEKLQRDAEIDKQREHSQALTDAANAMERVKQYHGHRLGWNHG